VPNKDSPEIGDIGKIEATSKFHRHMGSSMGMGARKSAFDAKNAFAPGPGAYNPIHDEIGKQSRVTGFGSGGRSVWGRCRPQNPDPGVYDVRNKSRSDPSIMFGRGGVSMTAKHPRKVEELGGGPAMYSPQFPGERNFGFSFGATKKQTFPIVSRENAHRPGPGHYQLPDSIGSRAGPPLRGRLRDTSRSLSQTFCSSQIAQPSSFP
jgi:hypothetical protein